MPDEKLSPPRTLMNLFENSLNYNDKPSHNALNVSQSFDQSNYPPSQSDILTFNPSALPKDGDKDKLLLSSQESLTSLPKRRISLPLPKFMLTRMGSRNVENVVVDIEESNPTENGLSAKDDHDSFDNYNYESQLTGYSQTFSIYEVEDAHYTSSFLTSHSWDAAPLHDIRIQNQPNAKNLGADKSNHFVKPLLLGTVRGVLVPCLQNLLGILLFLRIPYIVGLAGIGNTLLILLLTLLCSTLTANSLATIASNGILPSGGTYYIISRSLGKEIGLAVALGFWVGLALAGSIFILGAAECANLIREYILVAKPILDGEDKVTNPLGKPVLDNSMWIFANRWMGTILLWALALFASLSPKVVNRGAVFLILCSLSAILGIFIGLCTSNRDSLNHIRAYIVGFPGELKMNWRFPGASLEAIGGSEKSETLSSSDFFRLFALFFPSLTGIMVGSNRSGDLRTPAKSIPKGTLTALGISALIYSCFIILFGTVCSGPFLRAQSPNMGIPVSVVGLPHPLFILFGCMFSSLGAAMQCFGGASKIIHAVARDEILPVLTILKWMHHGLPLRAMLITFSLIQASVLIGSIDVVAPFTTMFFLICFACINLSTALLSLLQYPNWRPQWRFSHWAFSFLATIMNILYMFLINWIFAICCIVVVICLYKYVEYRGAAVEWGTGIRGLNISIAQKNLLILDQHETLVGNWRPQIIALLELDPNTRVPKDPSVLKFLGHLKKAGGLAVATSVIDEDLIQKSQSDVSALIKETKNTLDSLLKANSIDGFAQVLFDQDPVHGFISAIQCIGIGVLRPNTVMIRYPESWRNEPSNSISSCCNFVKIVRTIIKLEKVALVLKVAQTALLPSHSSPFGYHDFIDVYWIVHDGSILTILPYLLKKHRIWRKCQLRIMCVAQKDDNVEQMKTDLVALLGKFRIEAKAKVLQLDGDDMSEFTYEKTLRKEQRARLLEQLNNANNVSSNQLLVPSTAARAKKPNLKKHAEFLNTSLKLNHLMKTNSHLSALILVNLPAPLKTQSAADYMEYLDVLTSDMKRVLLVKGTGLEVVTTYV